MTLDTPKPKGTPPSDLSRTPAGVVLLINGERIDEHFPDAPTGARAARARLQALPMGATARIHVRGPFDSDPTIVRGRILASWFRASVGPIALDRGAMWLDYFNSIVS